MNYTIGQLFTDKELHAAFAIFDDNEPLKAQRVKRDIVLPIIGRINEKTGQDNDALYLAYVLQYAHSLRN